MSVYRARGGVVGHLLQRHRRAQHVAGELLAAYKLTGGTGQDKFEFTTTPNATTNVDTITDFSAVDGLIRLDNDFYTAFLTENVALVAAAFHSGPGIILAHDSTDRIIYNTTTGNLSYDPDGTGAQSSTLFATLTGAPSITAADFFIVA